MVEIFVLVLVMRLKYVMIFLVTVRFYCDISIFILFWLNQLYNLYRTFYKYYFPQYRNDALEEFYFYLFFFFF